VNVGPFPSSWTMFVRNNNGMLLRGTCVDCLLKGVETGWLQDVDRYYHIRCKACGKRVCVKDPFEDDDVQDEESEEDRDRAAKREVRPLDSGEVMQRLLLCVGISWRKA
jgi:DNA-directed RNA polymerase subunit RPC12/RpoP